MLDRMNRLEVYHIHIVNNISTSLLEKKIMTLHSVTGDISLCVHTISIW
jgi:hypothetical protein